MCDVDAANKQRAKCQPQMAIDHNNQEIRCHHSGEGASKAHKSAVIRSIELDQIPRTPRRNHMQTGERRMVAESNQQGGSRVKCENSRGGRILTQGGWWGRTSIWFLGQNSSERSLFLQVL